MREASNRALSGLSQDLLLAACMVLLATASFGLGYLAAKEGGGAKSDGFWVEQAGATTSPDTLSAAVGAAALAAGTQQTAVAPKPIPVSATPIAVAPASGMYLASKNGTKYYLPSCSGAKRIKDENKVWFATKADAEASGRTPASNCPGI